MFSGPHDRTLHPDLRDSDISALTAGAVTITFDPGDEEITRRPHWQASVEFYSDAAGATVVQPSAGTRAITVEVHGAPEVFQSVLEGGSIDLSAVVNQPAFWSANTLSVKAAMSGIVGATHCRLRMISNGV